MFEYTVWKSFARQLADHFQQTHCQKSAGALTYMTLFAIVPIMTVTYSMFSVIPAFQGAAEQLQQLIFNNFVPDKGQEVQKYLAEFSSQARNLTGVGVAMLVVTAYFMLKNIENTFNTIWAVPESRKGVVNFLLYWAVLTLGPLLLGIALAVSGYLLSLRLFSPENDMLGLLPLMLKLLPFVLTSAAFTLLFVAVPNCRVNFKHAAIGGLVTALAFEVVKSVFGVIVARTSLEAIYGAFAVVPLFLVWIYVMWMMVLAGAVFVRSLSVFGRLGYGRRYSDLTASLIVLWTFHQRWQQGLHCHDQHMAEHGVEGPQWRQIKQALLNHSLITQTVSEEFVLSKDLAQISIQDVERIIGVEAQTPKPSDFLSSLDWYQAYVERTTVMDSEFKQQYSLSLTELFAVEANPSSVPVQMGR